MIGSPAVRDSIDATDWSLRMPAASARLPAAIATAKHVMARRAGPNHVCYCF
jgi:hypothetical protein